MKYLVTGGAGFIGSNIVEELLNSGEYVRAFDNFSTGRRENIAAFLSLPNFEFIEGDLRNPQAVEKAVEGMDYVLHQGAIPSVPRSVADPITTNEVNILGTLHVLEAARKFSIKRVVCASSSSVYGNNPVLPKTETMPVAPLSPYALTKYAQERYCQIYTSIYGLETVSLRYFNVFGPRQDPTSQYSAVIPLFITAIANDKSPVIHGDGLQSRDFTYVSNNVKANILACTTPGIAGKTFNIACGQSYNLLQLVETINALLGKNISPTFAPPRPGDVKHSLADITGITNEMHFTPETDFMEGLKKTVEFFTRK